MSGAIRNLVRKRCEVKQIMSLKPAVMTGRNVDCRLVWNMDHGSDEGIGTGIFTGRIEEICS